MARFGGWKHCKAIDHSRKPDRVTYKTSVRLYPYFRQFPRGGGDA